MSAGKLIQFSSFTLNKYYFHSIMYSCINYQQLKQNHKHELGNHQVCESQKIKTLFVISFIMVNNIFNKML
jgi:hypothetical protein